MNVTPGQCKVDILAHAFQAQALWTRSNKMQTAAFKRLIRLERAHPLKMEYEVG